MEKHLLNPFANAAYYSVRGLVRTNDVRGRLAAWSDESYYWLALQSVWSELHHSPTLDGGDWNGLAATPDDLTAARDHRAMAGLSMGGMQTINIGLCECLDLFSAFGAFSAAPTSYPSAKIAAELKKFPEELSIRYFYNLCGSQDIVAYAAASAAAKKKPADSRMSEANWCWQERPGDHNFDIWNLGLYNFLKLLGSLQE